MKRDGDLSPWVLCGDCRMVARPDEYEPFSTVTGDCDGCGWTTVFVHRVTRDDVERAQAWVDAEQRKAERTTYDLTH